MFYDGTATFTTTEISMNTLCIGLRGRYANCGMPGSRHATDHPFLRAFAGAASRCQSCDYISSALPEQDSQPAVAANAISVRLALVVAANAIRVMVSWPVILAAIAIMVRVWIVAASAIRVRLALIVAANASRVRVSWPVIVAANAIRVRWALIVAANAIMVRVFEAGFPMSQGTFFFV